MNENIAHIILTKMKFKYSPDKKLFFKKIVPSGDPRGQQYMLFARYSGGDINMWLNPTNPMIFPTLGEVKLVRAIMEGKIDPKEWKPDETAVIENEQGGREIIELTPTPEELQEHKEEKEQVKVKEEAKDEDYFKKIVDITGYDIFEIFSDSGTGKSKITLEIARNSKNHGHNVFYYDTEGNITEDEAKFFGKNYVYSPDIDDLLNFNFPDVDLLVIDSVTYPFWIKFASMNMKERGEALLRLHAFLGKLKIWCVKNKKLAVVVSQAISELGKEEEERRPWGGKAFHIAKEIVKPELVYSKPNETYIKLLAYRMRKHGRGFHIADVYITNNGVSMKWKV